MIRRFGIDGTQARNVCRFRRRDCCAQVAENICEGVRAHLGEASGRAWASAGGRATGKGAGLVGRRSEEGPCFGHNLGGARGNSLFGEPNSNKNPRTLAASLPYLSLSPLPLTVVSLLLLFPHLLCSNTHSRKHFCILSSLFFSVCPVAHPLFPPFFRLLFASSIFSRRNVCPR